jgi:hypothetical protein
MATAQRDTNTILVDVYDPAQFAKLAHSAEADVVAGYRSIDLSWAARTAWYSPVNRRQAMIKMSDRSGRTGALESPGDLSRAK